LSPREQQVLEGLFKPTTTMARRGMRSALPRPAFSPVQVSFGHDRRRPDDMMRDLETVLATLRQRLQQRAARPAAQRAAGPKKPAGTKGVARAEPGLPGATEPSGLARTKKR
jgi:hypothetical protein